MHVIVVRGVANAGKSTIIKSVARKFGILVPDSQSDILLQVKICINSKKIHIGFASAGDRKDQIQTAINFFEDNIGNSLKPDFIIMACHTRGITIDSISNAVNSCNNCNIMYFDKARSIPPYSDDMKFVDQIINYIEQNS
jgi:hypothetical protein